MFRLLWGLLCLARDHKAGTVIAFVHIVHIQYSDIQLFGDFICPPWMWYIMDSRRNFAPWKIEGENEKI